MDPDFILDICGKRWHPGNLRRDEALAALAARQDGLIAERQLRALGLDWFAVRRRVPSGRLFVVGPGVFTVGHRHVSEAGRLLVAVLAYPAGARVGHRAAAEWWKLLCGRRSRVDVIAATGSQRPGTRLHRGTLSARERKIARGVPVTSVGRTLADIATGERPPVVEAAVHEAQVQRLLTRGEIGIAARASHRRGGGAFLRGLLEEIDPEVVLRSGLERRFYARLKAAAVPFPRRTARSISARGRELR